MHPLFAQSELHDLILEVEKGKRLDFEAGVRLMDSQDILALGYMANLVRERKNGNKTYFRVHNPINLKNICAEHINATLFYGDIKTTEERVDHLIKLRALQDKISGFLTFLPLSVDPKNVQLEGTMGVGNTTGLEDLKMLAVARILLDNFDHLKAFWMMLGPKLAQVSLSFGVDDLDGIVVEERSLNSVGAEKGHVMGKQALIQLIQKAGRDALERDALYRVLKTN